MSLESKINNIPLLRWLAQRTKEFRDKKKLTQLQCFPKTNVHIGRIEQVKRHISFTTLIKLCEYFKITPIWFFEGFTDFHKNQN